jgi:hypothetical protein
VPAICNPKFSPFFLLNSSFLIFFPLLIWKSFAWVFDQGMGDDDPIVRCCKMGALLEFISWIALNTSRSSFKTLSISSATEILT